MATQSTHPARQKSHGDQPLYNHGMANSPDNLRPTIVRLLSNMASAKEIQQYLKRFSQLDAARFAVVKVGGAILRDDLDSLVSSLAFLQQVGLTPIVLHGAGPQLDEEMKDAGVEKETVDGLRVTTPKGLAVVRRVSQRENLRLVEALQAQGVRATSITSGVFECDFLGKRKFGLVGKVAAVHTARDQGRDQGQVDSGHRLAGRDRRRADPERQRRLGGERAGQDPASPTRSSS